MTKMRTIIMALGLMAASAVHAQQYKQLWITGSAVPGGTQPLERVSDNDFKYAGSLKAGELKVITTKKIGKNTEFLTPAMPDANVVNHGIALTASAEANAQAWQVAFDDDHYRIHVYPDSKMLRGEVCVPWGELFIAGGATDAGWKEGKMLLMTQQLDNPYVWTWEGELRRHVGVEEPTSFKFQGQNRWFLKALYPYEQGTDILADNRLRIGGNDTKWVISKDGVYRITVDIFNEKVKAQWLRPIAQ